jgi:hypothetical protein
MVVDLRNSNEKGYSLINLLMACNSSYGASR